MVSSGLPVLSLPAISIRQSFCLGLGSSAMKKRYRRDHQPLKVISSIWLFAGNSLRASWILLRFPSASSLPATAFNRMGLLLIFVRVIINARDSAVELDSKKSSTLFGSRTLAKIESCNAVGVINTTYSSVQGINDHSS